MLTPETTRVDVRLKRALLGRTLPKELVASGPAGTGKTYGIIAFLHCLLRDNPGLRFLVCRKTRRSLTESALVTYENILASDGMEPIARDSLRRVRQNYRYPNGSELAVAGIDNPEKIKSSEWDLIFANEANEFEENDWEFLSSRLDRPGRRAVLGALLGDTNPDAPSHWLRRRADQGLTAMWVTTHEANPAMHDGRAWTADGVKYIGRLDGLTGVRYLRLRKGLWAGAEGLILDEFDPAVHLVDAMPAGWQGWRKIRSIDFGYSNPFVCQFWALDPDDRMYLYRELYGTRRLVSDWAREINRLSEGESFEITVADWDAEDRATLEAAGIRTLGAHKAVKPGIEAVQKRLRKAGDGRPRLFLLKGALVERDDLLAEAHKPTCLAEEVGSYIWAPPQPGRAPKEEPRKLDDHGCDAARYAVAYVDGLGYYSAGAY